LRILIRDKTKCYAETVYPKKFAFQGSFRRRRINAFV